MVYTCAKAPVGTRDSNVRCRRFYLDLPIWVIMSLLSKQGPESAPVSVEMRPIRCLFQLPNLPSPMVRFTYLHSGSNRVRWRQGLDIQLHIRALFVNNWLDTNGTGLGDRSQPMFYLVHLDLLNFGHQVTRLRPVDHDRARRRKGLAPSDCAQSFNTTRGDSCAKVQSFLGHTTGH